MKTTVGTTEDVAAVMATTKRWRVQPSGGPLGADIVGGDLRQPLDEEALRLIEGAWHDHLVLRFRGQVLTDDQLMAFSAHFGSLDPAPPGAANPAERPQAGFVTVISNIVVDGRSIGALGNYEALWHTDMSFKEQPPIGSLLYALEVPDTGGETGFANMYLAYETLPPPLKARVGGLGCIHDASRNSAGELRRGFSEVIDPRDAPGAVHPLVRTHPGTGRRALFLGRRKNAYVPGLDPADSEHLLDVLWAHATQPSLTWYQQWRVGDLIMWDNRCTMHRRNEFAAGARRLMHRTQISARLL